MEAMEERQVSQDGETRKLPDPFFVIATQNPVEQIGAYPLPESQLDRFLMAIEIGYPDPAAERELLVSGDRRPQMATLAAVADPPTLLEWQTRSRRRARVAGAARLRAGAARRHARQRRRRRRCRRAARAVAARGTCCCSLPRAAWALLVRTPDGAARGCAGGVPFGRRSSAGRRRTRRRIAGAGACCAPSRCRDACPPGRHARNRGCGMRYQLPDFRNHVDATLDARVQPWRTPAPAAARFVARRLSAAPLPPRARRSRSRHPAASPDLHPAHAARRTRFSRRSG